MHYLVILLLSFFGPDSSVQRTYSNSWGDYDGSGIVVGVGDLDGIYDDHEFLNPVIDKYADRSGNHATQIAGIIACTKPKGPEMGIAPGVQLLFDHQHSIIKNTGKYWKEYRMSITNNSYASGFYGSPTYSYQATELDKVSIEFDSVLHISSGGNHSDKFYTGNQSAKNGICVGNLNPDWHRHGNSCAVPTYDGRLGVHIMGLGVRIATISYSTEYATSSGSSLATPVIVGCAALLSEAMGGPQPNALLKNLLLNTARDIHSKGPDFNSGYGAVDVAKAIESKDNYLTDTIGSCASRYYIIPVKTKGHKIMITWNDPPSTSNVDTTLINDLDMTVNGFLPYVARPYPNEENKEALQQEDHLNNIEQVEVQKTDTLRIHVKSHALSSNQKFFITWD